MVDFCHLETNGITSWPMEVPGPIRLFPVGDHRTDDVTIIASTPCSCHKGTNHQNKGNMRSTPHALKWGMSQLQLLLNLATFSSTILNYWTTWNLHWEWSPIYYYMQGCEDIHKNYTSYIYWVLHNYTIHQIIFIVLLFLEWEIMEHHIEHRNIVPLKSMKQTFQVLLCWKAPWSSPVIPLWVWPCRSKIRSNGIRYVHRKSQKNLSSWHIQWSYHNQLELVLVLTPTWWNKSRSQHIISKPSGLSSQPILHSTNGLAWQWHLRCAYPTKLLPPWGINWLLVKPFSWGEEARYMRPKTSQDYAAQCHHTLMICWKAG